MDNVISFQDLRRDYTGCIVEYKGNLVLISAVEPGSMVLVYDLFDLTLHRVPFVFEDFVPVRKRLGYVNFGSAAAYFYRVSGRILSISLHPRNVRVLLGDFKYTPGEMAAIQSTNSSLKDSNLYQTLNGGYPSFEEIEEKFENRSSRLIAFDRQFAVSYKGGVYYKGRLVGEWDKKNLSREGISFTEENHYLYEVLKFNPMNLTSYA